MRSVAAKSCLEALLKRFFSELDRNSLKYCVIGNYDNLPYYTSNDVDFWVDNTRTAERLLLLSASEVGLRLYMQNKMANGSNNYFYAETGGGFEIVKIDLMSDVAYKSIMPIVKGGLIEKNRTKFKDFYVANETIEAVLHLLYPLVAFGVVKEKYKPKLVKLHRTDGFIDLLVSVLGEKQAQSILEEIGRENWPAVEGMAVKIRWTIFLNKILDKDIRSHKNIIYFLVSLVRRAVRKNGLVLSFTGIDGAGKSTIKDYLIGSSDNFFAKARNQEFYWRPFLLPRIAHVVGSKGQEEIIDRSGRRVVKSGSSSVLKNAAKYIYYVCDFVFGQVKYFKESHTGGLVVFDRYHFDNIVYPERFGFSLSRSVMRIFDRFVIPQPDILFYFTANTHVLYRRKQEIGVEEIESQKALYADEIKRKKTVIVIDTGCSLEDSVEKVLLECFKFMSLRY